MTGRALVLSGTSGVAPELERELARHEAVTRRIESIEAMCASLRQAPWHLVVCEGGALGGARPLLHEIVQDVQPGVPLLVLPDAHGNPHDEGVAGLVAGLERVVARRSEPPSAPWRPTSSTVRGIAAQAANAAAAPRSELRALLDHLRLASHVGAIEEAGCTGTAGGANPTAAARTIVDWIRGNGQQGDATLFEALDPTPDVDLRPRDLLTAVGHLVLFARRAAKGGPLLEVRTYEMRGGAWIEVSHDGPEGVREGARPPLAAPPDSGLVTVCELVLGHGGTVILDTAAQGGLSLRAWLPARA